jgi:hypothetical protein
MNKALYNKFIVLLSSRLLQTNNLPLKLGVNHIEPYFIQIYLFYKSLRFKRKISQSVSYVSQTHKRYVKLVLGLR